MGKILFQKSNSNNALIKSAQAQEIYDTFTCPCCGKPIDSDCCGMAEERKKYADSLMASGKSEEEVILEYSKKYGLDSFADQEKAKEFKEKLIADAPSDRPMLTINPESKDLGDISQKDGLTNTLFEIKNEGQKDLVINKLETSCGCTSASVVYQGKEGPKFTMPGHGQENPTDWQVTIKPGDSAQLKIYYDPTIHKDLEGSVIREIYVYSNDPIDFERKASIELNQTK